MKDKIFVDWSKTHCVLVNNEKDTRERLTTEDLLELVKTGSEVYLETGCPYNHLVYRLIKKDAKVYQIDGKIVNDNREGLKSSINDVETIRKLSENIELFKLLGKKIN